MTDPSLADAQSLSETWTAEIPPTTNSKPDATPPSDSNWSAVRETLSRQYGLGG